VFIFLTDTHKNEKTLPSFGGGMNTGQFEETQRKRQRGGDGDERRRTSTQKKVKKSLKSKQYMLVFV